MSSPTSAGRWTRLPICVGIPFASALAGNLSWPFLGGWGWPFIMVLFMSASMWTWNIAEDWHELYKWGMRLSDSAISLALPPYVEDRYVVLKIDRRFPPKLLWVMVSHDQAIRIYQGWNFWGKKIPAPRKVMKWGLRHKRVA